MQKEIGKKVNVFWFRRDLRLEDNTALYHALTHGLPVLPVFIFDTEILDTLPRDDARVTFIYDTLQELKFKLQEQGSSLGLYQGKPLEVFKELTGQFEVAEVFANHDYEPYAIARDQEIKEFLESSGIKFSTYKDQVIFEKDEIVKRDGEPYVVYTPYMNLWKQKLQEAPLQIRNISKALPNFIKSTRLPHLSLEKIGFIRSELKIPEYNLSESILRNYKNNRDFPGLDATTHTGPYLRFGTISIRKIVQKAVEGNHQTFLQELIWREFFMQILYHYPTTVTTAFKPQYDRIRWRNNEEEFALWKAGKTGYPLVDAGMRQMNTSGFMHNRIRMLVGSFLCKHLLIDWRWGEAYFAEKLLDYDMASNVGNWQWAAGSGVDAAPYFRIFNPTTQVEKFDRERTYIKKWVPEYETGNYPEPLVDHKEARERALRVYKEALA